MHLFIIGLIIKEDKNKMFDREKAKEKTKNLIDKYNQELLFMFLPFFIKPYSLQNIKPEK